MEIKKKNVGAMLVGEWNTKTIVAVAIGAALFGVLMCYGGIPIFTNTSLTTAMIIPVIVGALFGPLPAMVCCGVGNVIADLIGGWGLWFDWSVGNAVMAFCVGLLPVYGANIKEGIFTAKHAVIYAVCCILGNMVAFGVITPHILRPVLRQRSQPHLPAGACGHPWQYAGAGSCGHTHTAGACQPLQVPYQSEGGQGRSILTGLLGALGAPKFIL